MTTKIFIFRFAVILTKNCLTSEKFALCYFLFLVLSILRYFVKTFLLGIMQKDFFNYDSV